MCVCVNQKKCQSNINTESVVVLICKNVSPKLLFSETEFRRCYGFVVAVAMNPDPQHRGSVDVGM